MTQGNVWLRLNSIGKSREFAMNRSKFLKKDKIRLILINFRLILITEVPHWGKGKFLMIRGSSNSRWVYKKTLHGRRVFIGFAKNLRLALG